MLRTALIRTTPHRCCGLLIHSPTLTHQPQQQQLNFKQPARHASFEETATKIWKAVSDSTPVAYLQDGLVAVHDSSGLPWWATIILTTVVLRTVVTLPLTVYQFKIMGRLENISKEMQGIVEELKKETAIAIRKFKLNEQQAKAIFAVSAKKQWTNLIVRDNCHPAKTALTVWVQLPLWIVNSVAIRNLVNMLPDPNSLEAQIIYSDLMVGGFGWIPNLTEVDSSWVLPVALGIVNLSTIQVQVLLRQGQGGKARTIITNMFRGLSVLMVPIAATVPSCLTLYWLTSSTCALIQSLAVLSPRIRTVLGIPNLKQWPQERPYKFLLDKLLRRSS